MSFEPKTKVELDPPKDDVISLDYLSKCDGELESSCTVHSCPPDYLITGTNPDYPTYVAIKGTVFDVSGNKAYGPEGSYKGKSGTTASLPHQLQTKQFPQQSSLARTLLAHSDSHLLSPRSAALTGLICRTSTRRCSTTGSLSSASVTTSKARSRAPQTHNYGRNLLTNTNEYQSDRGLFHLQASKFAFCLSCPKSLSTKTPNFAPPKYPSSCMAVIR